MGLIGQFVPNFDSTRCAGRLNCYDTEWVFLMLVYVLPLLLKKGDRCHLLSTV